MEEQNFNQNTESSFNILFTRISSWLRLISVIGFSIGAFFIVSMLFSGKTIMESVEKAMPIKIEGLYGALVFVFFIFFFIAAAFFYFLYKAGKQLKEGAIKNDTYLLAEGFSALRNFFIMTAILGGLSLLVNISRLF